MDDAAGGHYYKTQIGSKNKVIAWSHQSRFDKALDLIVDATQKLLDYGCGDGTFLAMAKDRFVEGHGVDVDANQIEVCGARLGSIANLKFSPTRSCRARSTTGHTTPSPAWRC
jgi:hypothetical protein